MIITDTVHSLSSLPSTDGNFVSVLNRATDEEISQAIDVMENSSGQHKCRVTACKRELRKRMKARNNMTRIFRFSGYFVDNDK